MSASVLNSIRTEIESRIELIRAKHSYTANHCIAVGKLMKQYAKMLGCDSWMQQIYELTGLSHDLGKLEVINVITQNEGIKLHPNSYEMYQIQKHVSYGRSWIRESINGFDVEIMQVISGIQSHHEWYNGKGYPLCLRGEEIPLIGRITGVCCTYDAIINRMYTKKQYGHDEALAELRLCAGMQFDKKVVDTFHNLNFADINS